MSKFRWMLPMALLILLPTFSYPASLEYLRISLIEGDVQIHTEDTGEWVPASLNMPLKDGDRIWVPEGSRTELQLRDGSMLRLDERTAFDVLALGKDSSQFYLLEGRVYANFKGARGSFLQIDTVLSSMQVYERALFRIDMMGDRHIDLSVYQGSVDVESKEGRIRVDQNRTLVLREGYSAEFRPLIPSDEWERWNQNRNRIYTDRRPSSPYLPEELYPYASDFEDHGRWVYVRGYGHVWTPTTIVSVGWAPYRIGRWVWIRGDYVWISYEPWGWVPYHYGRWTFVPSIGWCWVPPSRGTVYWGPGFVGWVRTPTYISWVPLAPREIYYGYGNYGPYSVNILKININTINPGRVVYRNVRVHNAVTVVHHDTFVYGRPVEIRERENPFLREKVHLGRPDIKPERTTMMPVIREIPQVKRPPEKFRDINVREIRGSPPLTKEREAPVVKPSSPSPDVKPSSPPKETAIKSKEVPSPERGGDWSGRPPGTKEMEKRKEPPVTIKGAERPVRPKPTEGVEKPVEVRPVEKGPEPSKVQIPSSERIERQPVVKPQERAVEKPREKTVPLNSQPSPEDRKSKETGLEKSRERTIPDRSSGPVREREIQKPSEQSPIERPRHIQKEVKPERGAEKPLETKPPVREMDKPRPTPPPSSQTARPPVAGQDRVGTPPRVEQPEIRVERSQEDKPSGREPEKLEGVKPVNGGAGREKPPPVRDRRP